MALRRLPGVLRLPLAPVAPLALALLLCAGVCTPAFPPSPRRSALGELPGGGGGGRRSFHRVQHGACVYTFLLPEVDGCRAAAADRGGAAGPATAAAAASQSGYGGNPNALPQRDAPASAATPETEWPQPRLQQLETLLENNTQWLRKLEGFIQDSVHSETAQQQQTAVHNQTAAMLQIGTSLLSHTAEQTRKLSDVEAQVLNQTTRLEIQLLENSLSTNKLEREVLQQTHDISRLHDKNSLLERKVVEVEQRQQQELQALRRERDELQQAVLQRGELMDALERQLLGATHNQTVLQRQQAELTETVRTLLNAIAQASSQGPAKEDAILFSDCADAYEAGLTASGVYTVKISDSTEAMKVYCNMESQGGGWTVIQHRENGATDFHRPWQEYKMGFGDVAAEHWMGNQHVYYLSHQQHFVLRVELRDWEGNVAFSQYERFYISSEKLNYRIYVKGYTGTAGKYSSFAQSGIDFSTKDMDNDNCACKCAQMATGGWWFDACGPSNLNGMYYTAGQNTGKFNGIKWHYWKGSSYSLRSTTMMIRPVDFGV
ncbi:angiopoietin-2-like isoform X1 [Petromyzon marinus]|uniref:Angiopoietin-2-like isoform X2 n=1 Tax=Petromyzon marinus TaxID=7757 RepID=A0AAJ7TVX0_PETMA|nr:angiopoietin-2-like isoform X2 [Petromyzon marinus]